MAITVDQTAVVPTMASIQLLWHNQECLMQRLTEIKEETQSARCKYEQAHTAWEARGATRNMTRKLHWNMTQTKRVLNTHEKEERRICEKLRACQNQLQHLQQTALMDASTALSGYSSSPEMQRSWPCTYGSGYTTTTTTSYPAPSVTGISTDSSVPVSRKSSPASTSPSTDSSSREPVRYDQTIDLNPVATEASPHIFSHETRYPLPKPLPHSSTITTSPVEGTSTSSSSPMLSFVTAPSTRRSSPTLETEKEQRVLDPKASVFRSTLPAGTVEARCYASLTRGSQSPAAVDDGKVVLNRSKSQKDSECDVETGDERLNSAVKRRCYSETAIPLFVSKSFAEDEEERYGGGVGGWKQERGRMKMHKRGYTVGMAEVLCTVR